MSLTLHERLALARRLAPIYPWSASEIATTCRDAEGEEAMRRTLDTAVRLGLNGLAMIRLLTGHWPESPPHA